MMTSSRYGEPIVPEAADERLTLAKLQSAVWAADPAAFLVLPRIVRRVIKEDRQLAGFGLKAPHRKSYVIARESLLDIVDKADLGVADDFELPEKVILLICPGSQEFLEMPAGDLLTRCWRLLFHARVHLALEAKLAGSSQHAGQAANDCATVRQTDSAESARYGCTAYGSKNDAHVMRRRQSAGGFTRSARRSSTRFARCWPRKTCFCRRGPTSRLTSSLRRLISSCGGLRQVSASLFPGFGNLASIDELIGRDLDAESLYRRRARRGARSRTSGSWTSGPVCQRAISRSRGQSHFR